MQLNVIPTWGGSGSDVNGKIYCIALACEAFNIIFTAPINFSEPKCLETKVDHLPAINV